MAKSWKDALLATGLPLEHDVKKYLESRGCVARYEYSYLKHDEQRVEKQFSYDLDAAYIRSPHFVDLMVECKYRHASVSWVFTPDQYGGPDEVYPNAFLHPQDHFLDRKFPFPSEFPRHLAPCCSKGIELTSEGANPKAIAQALSQLAFGMAPQVMEAIETQVFRHLPGDHIFYHVPIIVTTATLFRLRDDVTLHAVRGASAVEDVATNEDCLVLKYAPGVELREYNRTALDALQARHGENILKPALKTFTEDLSHLFSVLADRNPEAVVVISVAKGWRAFDRFFNYLDGVLFPSKALVDEIRTRDADLHTRFEAFLKRSKKSGDSTA
jgi:hypothetical protein